MTVQVLYKNKAKSTNTGVIALFTEDKFQINNLETFLLKNEAAYVKKLLKNRKETKEKIISFNINEKNTLILMSSKKDSKESDIENLGAKFHGFLNLDKDKEYVVKSDTVITKINNFVGYFLHGLKLKSYQFNIYKSKKK